MKIVERGITLLINWRDSCILGCRCRYYRAYDVLSRLRGCKFVITWTDIQASTRLINYPKPPPTQLRNPDILATFQAELDTSIPSNVKIPSLEQVRLPYLDMLLKETLRYSSTGFGTFRICRQDTEISGITLPANTTLALGNPAGTGCLLYLSIPILFLSVIPASK